MKNLLFILIVGISFASCKKENCDPKTIRNFEVRGYLVNRSDSSPVNNGHIKVRYERNNAFLGGCNLNKISGEGYSDSTGYFAIDCEYYGGGTYTVNGLHFQAAPTSQGHNAVVDVDTIYR